MNSEVVNWISIVGSFLSLAGVIIAVVQIQKVKRAADAARDAANQTQKTISKNLLLSDVRTCIKNLDEIKSFVRVEKYESAQLRADDLVSYLHQIQQRTQGAEPTPEIDYKEMFSQITVIRKTLERKVGDSSARINKVLVNTQLSEISDDLNKLIGKTMIAIEKGE